MSQEGGSAKAPATANQMIKVVVGSSRHGRRFYKADRHRDPSTSPRAAAAGAALPMASRAGGYRLLTIVLGLVVEVEEGQVAAARCRHHHHVARRILLLLAPVVVVDSSAHLYPTLSFLHPRSAACTADTGPRPRTNVSTDANTLTLGNEVGGPFRADRIIGVWHARRDMYALRCDVSA